MPPKKSKKNTTSNTRGDHGEAKMETFAASMEKAKIVKEWISVIEMLSRVEGSAESIASILKIIDQVVNSAMSE